jgi:hypothetical protein
VPTWVSITRHDRRSLRFTAAPPQKSGRLARECSAVVEAGAEGSVRIREAPNGWLPAFCPQRHINSDGTFCLGYEADSQVIDLVSAGGWWRKLQNFLLCQDTASRTRNWPEYAQLSHGLAGPAQLLLEHCADELNKRDDVVAAMQGRGWIFEHLWQVTDDGKRLLNGRATCLCGRSHKCGSPKLRRECYRATDGCLMILEARRRDLEENFWKGLKNSMCCGTMEGCRLDPNYSGSPDRRERRRRSKPSPPSRG